MLGLPPLLDAEPETQGLSAFQHHQVVQRQSDMKPGCSAFQVPASSNKNNAVMMIGGFEEYWDMAGIAVVPAYQPHGCLGEPSLAAPTHRLGEHDHHSGGVHFPLRTDAGTRLRELKPLDTSQSTSKRQSGFWNRSETPCPGWVLATG